MGTWIAARRQYNPLVLPIACTLTDAELARRKSQLLAGVLREAQSVEPLTDGYRWRFPTSPVILSRLASVIDAERQCCRFLTFNIHADANLGDVVLEVTGPEGAKAVLSEWLA
jgi:hypothetical protein